MNRENLRKSGLLEQYVLRLTSRKESLTVQKILEEDPEAKKDFEKLREELEDYVINQGLQVPDDGREKGLIADVSLDELPALGALETH